MPFKDPKTGVLYPSKSWYQEKVDPETGQLYSSKVGNIKPDTEPYVKPEELEITGDLKMPEEEAKEPDLTKVNGRNNYWKKKAEEAEKEKEAKLKEYEQKLAEYEEESKSWLNKLTKQQTLTEKQQSLWEELGIKPADYFSEMQADIAEMDAMMDNYNKKEAQRDAALARTEDRLTGMPGAILSGEQKAINKQYNLELNQIAAKIKSQSAVMEMKQGNFQEARSFIKGAVQDYTYDLQLKYTQFEMFKEENKEVLTDLRQDYRDALDEAETTAYNEWVQTQEEKEAVLNLQLDYAGAGITIDDTLEEATKKAEEWKISQGEIAVTTPTTTTTLGNIKMVSYQTPIGAASLPININNINSATIERMRGVGMNDKDIRAWLDTNTKLTAGTINNLLEKEVTFETVKKDTRNTFEQMKNVGYTREQIEKQWKADNNATELTPITQDILDELFPETIKWWQIWNYNPLELPKVLRGELTK